MPSERDFESALEKYPELIEEGLRVVGRQIVMYGRRMDLVFSDRFQRTLLTELKWGPIKDAHIGQIMAYEGMLLSSADPSVRVMLIGTRVPPNLRASLDHHGIAWKEITPADLLAFVKAKGDNELVQVFDSPSESLRALPPRQLSPACGEIAVEIADRKPDAATEKQESVFRQALSKCKNVEALRFFENAVADGRRETHNAVAFEDADGKVRWYICPRSDRAYVVQKGRFTNDKAFWMERVQGVGTKRGGVDLRFQLIGKADFEAFQEVANKEKTSRDLNWEIHGRS